MGDGVSLELSAGGSSSMGSAAGDLTLTAGSSSGGAGSGSASLLAGRESHTSYLDCVGSQEVMVCSEVEVPLAIYVALMQGCDFSDEKFVCGDLLVELTPQEHAIFYGAVSGLDKCKRACSGGSPVVRGGDSERMAGGSAVLRGGDMLRPASSEYAPGGDVFVQVSHFSEENSLENWP